MDSKQGKPNNRKDLKKKVISKKDFFKSTERENKDISKNKDSNPIINKKFKKIDP